MEIWEKQEEEQERNAKRHEKERIKQIQTETARLLRIKSSVRVSGEQWEEPRGGVPKRFFFRKADLR